MGGGVIGWNTCAAPVRAVLPSALPRDGGWAKRSYVRPYSPWVKAHEHTDTHTDTRTHTLSDSGGGSRAEQRRGILHPTTLGSGCNLEPATPSPVALWCTELPW